MLHQTFRLTEREITPGFAYHRLQSRSRADAVVSYYWEIRAARCRTAVESALPDTGVEIYFNLGPTGRHLFEQNWSGAGAPRAAWVLGPRHRTVLVAKEYRDCDIVGIRLRASAAGQVLGVPAQELGGGLVDLDLLWGSRVEEIRQRLFAAPDTESRLEILEREVTRQLSCARGNHEGHLAPLLCQALRAGGEATVADLARRFGLSHRRVITHFDHHVGLKPKTFHRVARLRRVMKLAVAARRPPWAQVAVLSGFCDQAHMIHEFRRLTGMTPVDYVRRRTRVGDGFVPFQFAADVTSGC